MKSNILSKGVLQRMIEMAFIQGAISKVLGDLVSKVVSDGVDISIKGIKDADQNRKSYSQNLQTQIYHIIVDALNELTYNKYKEQNKLYNAAESILKGFINSKDNTDVVKSGLKMLVSQVSDEVCEDFLGILCREICKDENSDLYKEIDMLWKKQENEYFRGEFAKIAQNDREIFEHLNDLKEVLDFIKGNMNRQEGDKTKHNGFPIVNRADEYAEKWNENVFLNDFNEEDENAGINIKLREIYVEECLPHYIWRTNINPSKRLKNLLAGHINEFNNEKMLLILGQPGIGKSTLITWLMANFAEKKDKFLVYQFASDLDNVNWQGNHILKEILNALNLDVDSLKNKVLILDGFDEICIGRYRERILNILRHELKQTFWMKKFILIITCRENYVDKSGLGDIEYITLQAWDETQIRIFCEIYEEVIIKKGSESSVNKNSEIRINKIIEKRDIMGIPLILYMVLALNVDIERSGSTVDIYDQIFSLKRGGIYDREYDAEHRINAPKIRKHIHYISQRIAFWMFENNADKATIPLENFEEICENEMIRSGEKGEEIQDDTLIGNFFKLNHCEGKGTDKLQFVHRSIYEYFVVVYFYESIYKLKSKEAVAGKLGELLKDGYLSEQILEFIEYKFDGMKGYNLSDITKEVFNIMLRDGMTYYVRGKYKNIIVRESTIFSNMLEIVGLWNSDLGKVDDKIIIYLKCNMKNGLNLTGANLSEANLNRANLSRAYLNYADLSEANLNDAYLSGAYLRGADLRGTYLSGAELDSADLRGADLSGAFLIGAELDNADLSGANLSKASLGGAKIHGAYLRRVNLRGADLRGADLSEADLNGADLIRTIFDASQADLFYKKYDLSGSMVYVSETNETISYKEYCIRKQKK